MTDEPTIFIGNKPFMNYVTAVVMQFTARNAPSVTIRARGKFITRAVDVAEVAGKRFLEGNVTLKNIGIGSEAFQNEDNKTIRVSTIAITLERIKEPEQTL